MNVSSNNHGPESIKLAPQGTTAFILSDVYELGSIQVGFWKQDVPHQAHVMTSCAPRDLNAALLTSSGNLRKLQMLKKASIVFMFVICRINIK